MSVMQSLNTALSTNRNIKHIIGIFYLFHPEQPWLANQGWYQTLVAGRKYNS